MKKNKLVGMFLFIGGFLLILYPMISRSYYDINSREEVQQIHAQMNADDSFEDLYQQQVNYNQTAISKPSDIERAEVGFVEEPETLSTNQSSIMPVGGAIATLSIPKIGLVYPIYDGATHENLLKGVARIDGTSYPVGGIDTNSVIAGHNGLVDRTYFSYIKDLVAGDRIEIQNPKELLTYEVYDTAIIEPDDVGALAVIPGQDIITLLTCTWPPPGTHRYLVYARRIENQVQSGTVTSLSEKQTNLETATSEKPGPASTEQNTSAVLVPSLQTDDSVNQTYKILVITMETVRLFTLRYGDIFLFALGAIVLFYVVFLKKPKKQRRAFDEESSEKI